MNGTWYNPGSLSLSIPIGAWNVDVQWEAYVASTYDLYTSLSTSNNSESDPDFTAYLFGASYVEQTRRKRLTLAAKTAYYLIVKSSNSGGAATIGFRGDLSRTLVSAVSAYL